MEEEKLTIRVNINERFYPLKIEAKDEEKIRKAAKDINAMIAKYREVFKDKDGQDFLAMVALQLGTKVVDLDHQGDLVSIIDDVKTINRDIEQFLKE
ncbi:MAG: cell division protein ZapA [Bacteroidales bacterium]|nr:cell division protein ZapA [Bacteroidales bacterium]